MSTQAGDLAHLDDPIAAALLASTQPARLAYTWPDGTARVVPIWFHWDGAALIFGTPPKAPKLKALRTLPVVAVTIDSSSFPYSVLSVRGAAELTDFDQACPGYVAAAERYLGPEQGRAWIEQMKGQPMVEIRVVPEWVNIIDFATGRQPSALSA